MAIESVVADPGTGGSSFAVDTITGTVQVPYVKLMSGTDASEELIGGDAANGLDVDVTRVSGTVAVSGTFWQATQPVSGTVTANIGTAGSLATAAKQPALGTAGVASTDVITVQGIASMTPLLVTATLASTTITGTVAATQSGTWTVQPGNTANTTAWKVDGSAVTQPVSLATNTPLGTVAHDAADSGAPVKIGARAINAEIAAVANNDRSDLLTDLVGKLLVLPYANPENFVSGAITTAMTGTTSTSLLAAPAAGLRNYITQITVSNAHATVGTDIVIQDGSGGTTLYTIPAAAVYGGAVVVFPTPLRQPTTATAIFCANVTTGASTKVSASGYKGA